MKTMEWTNDEIRAVGLQALQDALGPAGMVRFIRLYYDGEGDYTRDRDVQRGSPTVAELSADFARLRAHVPEPLSTADLTGTAAARRGADGEKVTP